MAPIGMAIQVRPLRPRVHDLHVGRPDGYQDLLGEETRSRRLRVLPKLASAWIWYSSLMVLLHNRIFPACSSTDESVLPHSEQACKKVPEQCTFQASRPERRQFHSLSRKKEEFSPTG